MIKLDLNAEILLKYFRENKSQREISKELGISRTTVQKYIKEFQSKNERLQELTKDDERNRAEILLLIEEMVSKPKYDTSNRKKVELTDEVMKQIDKLVLQNERNKQLGRTKQLMKKVDIYEALMDKGYDIGYTTVCNYIKETYEQKEAYFRQEYALGEVLEFDWGEVKLTIDGIDTTLNMGHMLKKIHFISVLNSPIYQPLISNRPSQYEVFRLIFILS